MYLPKTDIYNSLNELGYYVAQTQPHTFTNLPAIIFRVGNNSVERDLQNNIISQDMEVIVDIWAESSVEASRILSEVEERLRQDFWKLTYSADIPNTGNLYHINLRFEKII